jgi:hypothetical protein
LAIISTASLADQQLDVLRDRGRRDQPAASLGGGLEAPGANEFVDTAAAEIEKDNGFGDFVERFDRWESLRRHGRRNLAGGDGLVVVDDSTPSLRRRR